MKNGSKFVVKGKTSYPKKQSAYLSSRSETEKGSISYKDSPSAFLAKRSETEKTKATFNDSRYK